ncbi:hypothetical protein V5799_008004 [Amblyomma americanum]|uniref:Uncharacterized protein n=1 Tax=Amblyomma americanum TaxID=6943 RepID=A0AAQ4FEH6_AMBAM
MPEEEEMPSSPVQEGGFDHSLAALMDAFISPTFAPPSPNQVPPAGFGDAPEHTPSVWSQQLDMNLGLLPPLQSPPPQQQARTPYKVLLSPQMAVQTQRPPVARPMPTPSPAPTLQSNSAESSLMSPLYNLHMSPPAWCTGIDETPVGSQLGLLCAQGLESRPSSRLSSSSQSLSVHTPLPSFLGSPGRQLGHMEPQLQPLVEWELKTERFTTPPTPSIYLNTEQELQAKPVYSCECP